jgi:hypothetical protein
LRDINVIKSRVGTEAKQGNYSEVVVVSHDKGYKKQTDKANKNGKAKCHQEESVKNANKKSKK